MRQEAETRRDRAKAELKAAEQMIKAIEGYEKLEEQGVIAVKPETEASS